MKPKKEFVIGIFSIFISVLFSCSVLVDNSILESDFYSKFLINISNPKFWSTFGGAFIIVHIFIRFITLHITKGDNSIKYILLTLIKGIFITYIPFTLIGLLYLLLCVKFPELNLRNSIFVYENHYYYAIVLLISLSIYAFYLRSFITRRRIVQDKLSEFLDNLYLSKEYKHILNSGSNARHYRAINKKILSFMIKLIESYAKPFQKIGKLVSSKTDIPFIISAWILLPDKTQKIYNIIGAEFSDIAGITIFDKLIDRHKPKFLNKTMLTKLKNQFDSGDITKEEYYEKRKKYFSATGYFSSKANCSETPAYIYKNINDIEYFDHSYQKYINNSKYYHKSLISIPLCLSGKQNACLFIFSNAENHFPENVFQFLQPLALFLMFVLEQSKINNVSLT